MKKVPNQKKGIGTFSFWQATGCQRMGTDARILTANFFVHPLLGVLIPASLMKGII